MTHRLFSSQRKTTEPIDSLVELWMLRVLVPLDGQSKFINLPGFSSEACSIGFPLQNVLDTEFCDEKLVEGAKKQALLEFKNLYLSAEYNAHHAVLPPILSENVARLARKVGLSPTDCQILEFSILVKTDRRLGIAVCWLQEISTPEVFHALSIILNVPEKDIRVSLSEHSILLRLGLVTVISSENKLLKLPNMLEMHYSFPFQMINSNPDLNKMLEEIATVDYSMSIEQLNYLNIDASMLSLSG